jgi:hypothetical protein
MKGDGMDKKNGPKVTYRIMAILAVVVGVAIFVVQFLPGPATEMAVLLCPVMLGGLIGGAGDYRAHERAALDRSYRKTFEWLFLIVFCTYALLMLSRWLIPLEAAAAFLGSTWPGLMLSVMCMLMGITGLWGLRLQRST